VASAAAGKPILMTEYGPSAPAMFETAWLIHEALTAEPGAGNTVTMPAKSLATVVLGP
jgi:hypothetical protein